MKRSTLILSLAPVLLAGTACAQFFQVSPVSPRINPLAGLPTALPSPVINPALGGGVRLPSPISGVVPTAVLAAPAFGSTPLAAVPAAVSASAVYAIGPAPVRGIPAFSVDADHENVGAAVRRLLPSQSLRLAGVRPATATKSGRGDAEKLDRLFDRGDDNGAVVQFPRRGIVEPSQPFTTPETDLERELGLGQ
jgi:hypothetical protein